MTMTVAAAGKLLKKWNEEHLSLLADEEKRCRFIVSIDENVESVRPAYDYAEAQEKIAEIETKIRKLKHAVNIFNTTNKVDGFDMTVDEVLVLIPQLTARKTKLARMKSYLPKERHDDRYSNRNTVEYDYINYDAEAAQEDYTQADEMLSRLQMALDGVNSTRTVEVEL